MTLHSAHIGQNYHFRFDECRLFNHESKWHLSFSTVTSKVAAVIRLHFKALYIRCSLSNQTALCLWCNFFFFFGCFYNYKFVLNKFPHWSADLKCFFCCCCCFRLKQFTTTNIWLQMRGMWEYCSRVTYFFHLNWNSRHCVFHSCMIILHLLLLVRCDSGACPDFIEWGRPSGALTRTGGGMCAHTDTREIPLIYPLHYIHLADTVIQSNLQ